MAKVLNLDELVPASEAEQRVISIKGKEHPVLEMTVENFIKTSREARRLEESNAPMDEQVEATVAMIVRFVPTLKREDLAGYSLAKLGTLVSFVRGDDMEKAAAAAEAQVQKTAHPGEEGAGKS